MTGHYCNCDSVFNLNLKVLTDRQTNFNLCLARAHKSIDTSYMRVMGWHVARLTPVDSFTPPQPLTVVKSKVNLKILASRDN